MLFNKDISNCLNNNTMEESDSGMKVPEIENEPHLLISKVRKRYFEYIIQLLSKNCGLKTDEKRIPSSIWRCARKVEMNAVKMCMVVPLYRKNIFKIVNRIKHETSKGRIYTELKTFIKVGPTCDKKVQTDKIESANCQSCNRKRSHSESDVRTTGNDAKGFNNPTNHSVKLKNGNYEPRNKKERLSISEDTMHYANTETLPGNASELLTGKINGVRDRISLESASATNHSVDNDLSNENDQIFKDMEELFKSDDNKEEDIFDQNFNNQQFKLIMDEIREFGSGCNVQTPTTPINPFTPVLSGPIAVPEMTLDERIAEFTRPLVEATKLPDVLPEKTIVTREVKGTLARSKWTCELFFRKKQLSEKLDFLCEMKYRQWSKVKARYEEIFGVDSENEQAPLSPQDDYPEFIYSCKERIAPWIVKNLMPHYLKGKIKSKYLFKGVAKHVLKILIEGDRYPDEHHVRYFIHEYMKYHPVIRCEGDFV